MRAGRYDKRVTIEASTESRDSYGTVTRSWSTADKRWARVEDMSGRDYFNAQQVDSDVTVRVTLREAFDGLTPRHRFTVDGRTLNISHIIRPQRTKYGEGQQCMCKEVQ